MDSRWLYRAAGSVGLASGIWLLGAGGAQADETENLNAPALDGLLGGVVSPTAGLTGGLVGSQLPLDSLTGIQPGPVGLPAGLPAGLPSGLPTQAADAEELVSPALLPSLTGGLLAQTPVAPLAGSGALPVDPASVLPVSPTTVLPVNPTSAVPVDPASTLGVPVPDAGEQLPALIADQLAAEAGLSPEHLTPALPELPVLGAVSGLVPGF